MIMKKSTRNFIAIVIIIMSIVIISVTIFAKNPRNVGVTTKGFEDNGYQLAITQKLIKEVSVPINEMDATINGIGFDGLRLYVCIKINTILESNQRGFSLVISGNNSIPANHFYHLGSEKYLVIWDNFVCNGDQDLQLILTTKGETTYQSDLFKINGVDTSSEIINVSFEELYLKEVKIAETSTLFDFELSAFINVKGFQIETEEGVYSDVYLNKDKEQFQVIFPTVVNLSQKFKIHGKDKDGFAIMTIPIENLLLSN